MSSIEVGTDVNNSTQEMGITSYAAGSPVADAANGVVLRFERSVNSTNFLAVSFGGGTRTNVDTGIAYSSVGSSPSTESWIWPARTSVRACVLPL